MQVGLQFEVCFRARNTNSNIPVLGPDVDILRCIKIQVVRPILSWTDHMPAGSSAATQDLQSSNQSGQASIPTQSVTQSVSTLTPPADAVFETFPGCYLEIPMYANAVWYKTIFAFDAHVQEFNGSYTRMPSLLGATMEAPNPRALISPQSYTNIANNYSHRSEVGGR
jgi:hypothetical protein